MEANYKILLTAANNPLNCESEYIQIQTSLSPAHQALLAQVITVTLSALYSRQQREMLCLWELDVDGNEQKFYQ